MGLMEHFERELAIMRKSVKEDDSLIIEPYVEPIKQIIEIFSNEGHSGGSAPFTSSVIFQTLRAVLGFQVLSPLTGEDDEWIDISEMHGSPMWQNIRDSGVFKDEKGNCTYNAAIVWMGNESWDRFTGMIGEVRSSNYIKEFPFMPKTFYIDVVRELYDPNDPEHESLDKVETGHGTMVYKIKDLKQLAEVFNYYNPRPNEKSV